MPSSRPTDPALKYRLRTRLFARLDEMRAFPVFPQMTDDEWAGYKRFMWPRYLELYDAPDPKDRDMVNRWLANPTPTEWPGWDALLHDLALQLAFDQTMRQWSDRP